MFSPRNKCFYTIVEVNNLVMHDCGKNIFDHILKHLEMFMQIITGWIWIDHMKICLLDLYNCHKITIEKSFFCANLIKAFIASNDSNKQNKPNMWRSQRRFKLNLAWTTETLSFDISIISVLYFAITHFKGSKMFIHRIFTFHKIFNPHVSMISTSLVNSKCCIGELE